MTPTCKHCLEPIAFDELLGAWLHVETEAANCADNFDNDDQAEPADAKDKRYWVKEHTLIFGEQQRLVRPHYWPSINDKTREAMADPRINPKEEDK